MTASLLALVVSLLREDSKEANPELVIRVQYMFDLVRVLLDELPAAELEG
jgi:hypothetical protein